MKRAAGGVGVCLCVGGWRGVCVVLERRNSLTSDNQHGGEGVVTIRVDYNHQYHCET